MPALVSIGFSRGACCRRRPIGGHSRFWTGIVGLVQTQAANWAIFAPPGGNPLEAHDALAAAAKFLCVHGAAHDLASALFAYNHADWYVRDILSWAQMYSAELSPSLANSTDGVSAAGWAGRPDILCAALAVGGVDKGLQVGPGADLVRAGRAARCGRSAVGAPVRVARARPAPVWRRCKWTPHSVCRPFRPVAGSPAVRLCTAR